LQADAAGRWSSPVRGGDVYAALLVDAGWTPPAVCGTLPQGAAILARTDSQIGLRRIEFASRTWVVKEAPLVAAGPGPNYWGGANDQVWVDAAGGLHLRVTAHDGRWEAAEVYSEEYVGYGRIRFTVAAPARGLDPQRVFAGFLYDDSGAEMDVEWSPGGDAANAADAQYVVHPDQLTSFALPQDAAALEHTIDWRTGQADFAARAVAAGVAQPPFASWSVRAGVPAPGAMRLRFNLWLLHGAPPTDGAEAEIVVTGCELAATTDVAVARPGTRLAVASPIEDGTLRFRLEAAAGEQTAVTLFDPRGRRVASVFEGRLEAGSHPMTWAPPARLAAGVYWLQARIARAVRSAKVVVLP
jgi:hypothetical protein